MKNKYSLILLALTLASCSDQFEVTEYAPLYTSPSHFSLTKAEEEIVNTTNTFAIDFLSDLLAEENGNVVYSPLSIQVAMMMAETGANGDTREQIHTGMGLNGISSEDIAAYYTKLLPALASLDPISEVSLANSFWFNKELNYKESYEETLTNCFDAEVHQLDETASVALDDINGWVKDKTNGRIPKILNNLTAGTLCVLLNALTFESKWHFGRFVNVENGTFYGYDGKQKAEFMTQKFKTEVLQHNDYTSMCLPYGSGKYGLQIVLPNKGKDICEVLGSFNCSILSGEDASNVKKAWYCVDFKIPKFDTESTISSELLIKILNGRGIKDAFIKGKADFSGITDTPMNLDEMAHKAKMSVSEKGTSAAAATALTTGATGIGPDTREFERFEFSVDRPFVYFITEMSTGTILFAGVQREF